MLTVAPAPAPAASLVLAPGPGPQRALVQRDHEHARVVDEQVLRPVAVVDVPVEDADALDTRWRAPHASRPRPRSSGRTPSVVPRRRGDRAVARRRRPPARVPRAPLRLPSHAAPAASRVARNDPAPAQVSASSQPPTAAARSSAARYAAGWTRSSSSARRLARLSLGDTGADGADPRERRGEASGRLGMAAGRGMLRACGVGQDENGHPLHTC